MVNQDLQVFLAAPVIKVIKVVKDLKVAKDYKDQEVIIKYI